jgi:thiol-disulfide isomerase/thioredoxin
MKKRIGIAFVLIFLLTLVTTIFRGWANLLIEDVIISYILYLVLAYAYTKYIHQNTLFAFSALSGSLLFLILISIIVDGQLPTVGLPNMVAALLGILCGVFFATKYLPSIYTALLSIVILCGTIWYVIKGNDYWFDYLNGGTFDGSYTMKTSPIGKLYNQQDAILVSELQRGIILLDFWNTSCYNCSINFPKVDEWKRRYNSRIKKYSVNVPLDNQLVNDVYKIYDTTLRKLPLYFSDSAATVYFNITAYPTYVVMENGNILYKGSSLLRVEDIMENILLVKNKDEY